MITARRTSSYEGRGWRSYSVGSRSTQQIALDECRSIEEEPESLYYAAARKLRRIRRIRVIDAADPDLSTLKWKREREWTIRRGRCLSWASICAWKTREDGFWCIAFYFFSLKKTLVDRQLLKSKFWWAVENGALRFVHFFFIKSSHKKRRGANIVPCFLWLTQERTENKLISFLTTIFTLVCRLAARIATSGISNRIRHSIIVTCHLWLAFL